MAGTSAAETSGRYAGVSGDWRLELRVDIEGDSALDIISGELWRQREHVSRFLVHGPQRAADSRLTAPLPGGGQLGIRLLGGAEAEVELNGLVFAGRRFSPFFRDLTLQPAIEHDLASHWLVDGFRLLPLLTRAYAHAGINLAWRTPYVVKKPTPEPGWAEGELRNVMAPLGPSLLFAGSLQGAANIRGLTVESGSAVFLHSMASPSGAAHRHGLFTCVHEIGHTLQLTHALPAECSWMSVPARYPGGEEIFFRHFEAKFLYRELQYLRHETLPLSTVS